MFKSSGAGIAAIRRVKPLASLWTLLVQSYFDYCTLVEVVSDTLAKSRYYKERQVDRKKRQAIRW